MATAAPLLQPFFGSWHVAQATVLSSDIRGSKYNCFPSAIFSAVGGFFAGCRTCGNPVGTVSPARNSEPSSSAADIYATMQSRRQRTRNGVNNIAPRLHIAGESVIDS